MKSIIGLGAVIALAGQALAVTPFTETFSYANGDLTSVSGGQWVNHSGTGGFIQVNGGAAFLQQGSGSLEDANRSFGGIGAGETVFYGMDVTMSGSGPATDTYFAHVKNSSTFFSARVWASSPNAGGDYSYGFSSGSSIGGEWATDFSYGSTQRVVASYNFDTGAVNLWINPSSMSDPHITLAGIAGDAMEALAFRQAAGNTGQKIDNVAVGTSFASVVPTPGAAALMGFAGLAATRRRRSA